jgi:hypothetical protein
MAVTVSDIRNSMTGKKYRFLRENTRYWVDPDEGCPPVLEKMLSISATIGVDSGRVQAQSAGDYTWRTTLQGMPVCMELFLGFNRQDSVAKLTCYQLAAGRYMGAAVFSVCYRNAGLEFHINGQ